MKKYINSFGYAFNGLQIVWREERNFRVLSLIALLVYAFGFIFNFSLYEFTVLTIAVVLVLSAEILNTAVEDLCNKIEPNEDPIIKKVKDMMSAFTLTLVVGAAVLGVFLLIYHFGY